MISLTKAVDRKKAEGSHEASPLDLLLVCLSLFTDTAEWGQANKQTRKYMERNYLSILCFACEFPTILTKCIGQPM